MRGRRKGVKRRASLLPLILLEYIAYLDGVVVNEGRPEAMELAGRQHPLLARHDLVVFVCPFLRRALFVQLVHVDGHLQTRVEAEAETETHTPVLVHHYLHRYYTVLKIRRHEDVKT